MTDSVNTRELILGILMEVTKEGSYSHLVIRSVLDKYQYLEKKERAFITRVSEGTIQRMIELDAIINQFSKTKVKKMKPVIAAILRSGVYQLKYMDSVPDSAVCNEAVKLAKRKGFGSLSGFVNGVLRSLQRSRKADSKTRVWRTEGICKRCDADDCAKHGPDSLSGCGKRTGAVFVCQIFYTGMAGAAFYRTVRGRSL